MGIGPVELAAENSEVAQGAYWKIASEAKLDIEMVFEQVAQMANFKGKPSASYNPLKHGIFKSTQLMPKR